MNSGAKVISIGAIGMEMELLLYDARWMLLLIFLCIIADFQFGWKESNKRYREALEQGDTVLADKYRWHLSRALRRTGNKFMDYIVWVSVGLALGLALLQPLGIDYTLGGVAATAVIVCGCELPSAFGHFFYLHGVQVEKKTVTGFVKAFTVALAKRKDRDVGEALEDAISN